VVPDQYRLGSSLASAYLPETTRSPLSEHQRSKTAEDDETGSKRENPSENSTEDDIQHGDYTIVGCKLLSSPLRKKGEPHIGCICKGMAIMIPKVRSRSVHGSAF